MLQQMRGLAKYIWVLVALFFVGGFLLYQTSGLIGRTPVTPTTAVAVVNGHEILYTQFENAVQQQVQSDQQQHPGQTLSEDETKRIKNQVFDQMVADILLQDEYRKRGIIVTDDEIREVARIAPPPWIENAPELQTNGQFDAQKYQRLLTSAQAREGGLLVELEQYYRSEIPKEKLIDEVTSGVYVTDADLWRTWRDQHDSIQVSYVEFAPQPDSNVSKSISDDDLHAYFDKHKADFKQPGRAVLSVLIIPRTVTEQDTAAARAKAAQLRDEIVKGGKFEDVAKRESADSASAANGGDLGKQPKSMYVTEFSKAADALKVGEISQPVLTPFGFHIIRLDARKGDTLSLHHILVPIQSSDSEATRVDKEADVLSRVAASSEDGKKLDSAAKQLQLSIFRVIATEDQPAMLAGRVVPSVSAWAFTGAHAGETSELYDDNNGYYLARLDTLRAGGEPKFEDVKEAVRGRLAVQRSLDKQMTAAQKVATAATSGGLESAAQQAGLKVQQTPLFTRTTPQVPGLGAYNEAIGAAFALPVGTVSQPVRTDDAVFVLRPDKRTTVDSAAWVAQKQAQRTSRLQQLRSQMWQMFLQEIHDSAKIDDRRKRIDAATRRADTCSASRGSGHQNGGADSSPPRHFHSGKLQLV